MIDYQLAKALFDYDPVNGDLTWRVQTNATPKGKIAGTIKKHKIEHYTSYICVTVFGEPYKAHRVIWLLQTGKWPTKHIDHIDGNGLNNSWSNLREVTASQNAMNQKVRSDSASGIKGVSYDKARDVWYVYIDVDKKRKHLGRYETKDEAAAARLAAEKIYHGEYARKQING
jgi:hypothetical protein